MSTETNFMEVYQKWCSDIYFDEETRKELKRLNGNKDEIKDRFYRRLEFGTGGLRGIIGAGTNRMNIYTVRQATQGLANYIISKKGQDKGVAIAFDSRKMSPEFARETALCLCANGIHVYLFETLRPTPELSFAVRKLKCIAGVVITASHNPKEYNGYKVYWEDGAQITPPHDKNIILEVGKVTDYNMIYTVTEHEAVEKGLYHVIGNPVDDEYISEIKKQSINPDMVKKVAKDIKIVYTPLNGAGNIMVRKILREMGFEKLYVVEEQEKPDGNFPTVRYPNPEDDKAWELSLRLAKKVDADIVIATDPDADRLGIYAKDVKTGKYVCFTGNMSGVLIADYIVREKTVKGEMPENAALIETIVTTDMLKAVAKDYNISLIEVLTGFKYIGEQIKKFEQEKSYNFLFGMEESYGCLAGTYTRDKDACVSAMLICEVASYYKKQGKTLCDAMEELYIKYGYYKEGLVSNTYEGASGLEKIKELMERHRKKVLSEIGEYRVLRIRDYLKGNIIDLQTNHITETGLPVSDVIYYELEGGAWCCLRPSGTEPKIKYYFGVKGKYAAEAEEKFERMQRVFMKMD